MAEQNEILTLARERGERRLDKALGDIRAALLEVAKEHDIPEGVLGHSVEDLLGRIMFVPSMSRDLRREVGQLMAKQELERMAAAPPAPGKPAPEKPAAVIPGVLPVGRNLADVPGITVQQIKALQGAGIIQIGDLVNMPDEHLAKVTSLDAKAIGKIRAAVAKAAEPVKP